MITDSFQYLDPWSVDYSPSLSFNTVSTAQMFGLRDKRTLSNRSRYVFTASRVFSGNNADDKLAFFEYYVRVILNHGTNKFLDKYYDSSGIVEASMMILGGNYSVQSDGVAHTVSCEIEVFE